MQQNDDQLWEKVKNDDNLAFGVLFQKFYKALVIFAFGFIKNKSWAEEIVNDVFLKIWQKRKQIQINFGIKAYIYRSVFNETADYMVKNCVTSDKSFVDIDDQINQIVGSNEDYIIDMLNFENVEKDVMEAIQQLPPKCQEIFCSSRFELLTYNEISERYNISVNTVKTQIGRAIESLRQQLGKYL